MSRRPRLQTVWCGVAWTWDGGISF